MQAVILAGGLGTRLRPLTLNVPKPIVPIGNQPFLLRQIESLKAGGVTDITLSLNYEPSAIENVLGDGTAFGVNLRYLIEPAPLGTAGAYKFAEQFLNSSTIVLNGDILTDIDLQTVTRHHQDHKSIATIVLTEVKNPSAYGLVHSDKDSKVVQFLEKPNLDEINELKINTINAGIYIFEPKVLDLIPKDTNYSFEYQLFPDLLNRKELFHAFVASDNYWLDIGTLPRYLQAHQDLMRGKIKNFQVERTNKFHVADLAEIDELSCLAEGCIIEKGAKIINSILGKDVVIEKDAVVQNSVIWSRTKIFEHASIIDSIIGSDCQIGKNVFITNGSVLGDETVISDFSFC